MTWVEAARGPFERLLEAEAETGSASVRKRLEGLRLAYLDLRAGGSDRPLAECVDAARTKGPWVLWMLRRALSPPAFEPTVEAWKRGRALDTASLRAAVERAADADFGSFFDFWVYGVGLPEYRLLRAEAKADGGFYHATLQVENLGVGEYPAPFVVQTEEGARHELAATAPPGARAEVQCRLVTKPVLAAVDPEADVLMACGDRPWLAVRTRKFWIF